MAREWDDIMGERAPEGGHSKNEGQPYSHWMDKELKNMTKMDRTEASADERAFRGRGNERTTRGGMDGGEIPGHDIFERERGDSKAPGRNVDTKFEAEPFDMDQFDRGDDRVPEGHSEGSSAPRRKGG